MLRIDELEQYLTSVDIKPIESDSDWVHYYNCISLLQKGTTKLVKRKTVKKNGKDKSVLKTKRAPAKKKVDDDYESNSNTPKTKRRSSRRLDKNISYADDATDEDLTPTKENILKQREASPEIEFQSSPELLSKRQKIK